MDMIPLDQAAVIRLSKTFTPDMDAEGPVSLRVRGNYSDKFLSIGAIAAAVAATRRRIVILHSVC